MFGPDLSLHFRVFGIPVQVSLFFLVMAVLLGQGTTHGSPVLLVAWVLVVFVSVLLHELGHALTARAFGQQPYITLHAMGGLTTWRQREEMPAGRRLLVAVAGPGIGIALGLFVFVLGGLFTVKGTTARTVVLLVVYANFFWGALNLIPMLPLDGGSIMAALFDLVAPGRGRRAARYVSVVTALAAGAVGLATGMFLLALYCGLSIWLNVQELRQPPAPPPAAAEAVIDVPAQAVPEDRSPDRPS